MVIFSKGDLQIIKVTLKQELKKIEDQIKSIESSDFLSSQALPETSEVSTASWEDGVKAQALAIKQRLIDLKNIILKTLRKLKEGTYGICERCKNYINPQRLEALPMALTCSSC